MKLITISGLDGSGKTSQLVLLNDNLKDRGKNVFMYHAVKFSLATKIIDKIKTNKKEEESKSQKKAKTKASPISIFLRKIFLIIDIFRFRSFYKKLEKQKVDYILSDRYFYDQIVNIHFLEKKKILELEKWWVQLVLKYTPKPYRALFLEVSPLTILSREKEIEQGAGYLEKKFSLYEELAKDKNTSHIIVNGEQSKTEVLEEIKKILNL